MFPRLHHCENDSSFCQSSFLEPQSSQDAQLGHSSQPLWSLLNPSAFLNATRVRPTTVSAPPIFPVNLNLESFHPFISYAEQYTVFSDSECGRRKRDYLKTMTSPRQHHLAVDHSSVSIQDSGQTLSDGFLVDRCDF